MKNLLLKITFISSLLTMLSAVNLANIRDCELNNEKIICKLSNIINKPGRLILTGWSDAQGIVEHIIESGKITLYGSHSKANEPLETRERFKELNPGFEFNYKPFSREKAGYLLISKFAAEYDGAPTVELWDLNEQTLINKYNIDWISIEKGLGKGKILDLFLNPILFEDGSLLLNSVGGWGGAIVKIDKCGKYIAHNSDYYFHHSIEIDSNGNVYSPIENATNSFEVKDFHSPSFSDHGFAILDKNLNVKKTFSLLDIYKNHDLESDIYGGDRYSKNPFHLNVVMPFIRSDGNPIVLLSLLTQSSVLAFDLNTEKIIWKIEHATMHQHDVDVIGNKKDLIDISIFDNRTAYYSDRVESLGNEIVILRSLPTKRLKGINMISDKVQHSKYELERISFNNLKKDFIPKTKTGGRSDFIIANNSFMIEETDYGRIFEIDYTTKEILWQYVNKTKKNVSPFQLSWSRRLSDLPGNLDKREFQKCW